MAKFETGHVTIKICSELPDREFVPMPQLAKSGVSAFQTTAPGPRQVYLIAWPTPQLCPWHGRPIAYLRL